MSYYEKYRWYKEEYTKLKNSLRPQTGGDLETPALKKLVTPKMRDEVLRFVNRTTEGIACVGGKAGPITVLDDAAVADLCRTVNSVLNIDARLVQTILDIRTIVSKIEFTDFRTVQNWMGTLEIKGNTETDIMKEAIGTMKDAVGLSGQRYTPTKQTMMARSVFAKLFRMEGTKSHGSTSSLQHTLVKHRRYAARIVAVLLAMKSVTTEDTYNEINARLDNKTKDKISMLDIVVVRDLIQRDPNSDEGLGSRVTSLLSGRDS